MNKQIRDIIFFMICITFPFYLVPKAFEVSGIVGAHFSTNLAFYPIFLFFIYTFYCHIKNGNVLIYQKQFLKFTLIYLIIMMVSFALGINDYLNIVNNEKDLIAQVKYYEKAIKVLTTLNLQVEEIILCDFIIITTFIKRIIWDYIFSFFLSYIIFCMYYNDWRIAVKQISKAVLLITFVIAIYNIVEIFYLCGSEYAKNILIKINPYIYNMSKWDGVNWPPILWKGGIRGLFTEASHYGIYFAFAIPFLWIQFLDKGNKYLKVILALTMFITACIFMTNARTSYGVYLFQIFIAAIIFKFSKNTFYFQRTLILLLTSVFIFVGTSYFMNNYFIKYDRKIDRQVIATVPKNTNHNKSDIIFTKDKNETKTNEPKNVTKKSVVNDLKSKNKEGKNNKIETSINIEDKKKNSNFINSMFEKSYKYLDNNLLSLFNVNKRSNSARFSKMYSNIRIALDNPFFGSGPYLSNVYISNYLPDFSKNNNEVKSWLNRQKKQGLYKYTFPKLGEYTVRIAETGIVGLVAFLYPFIYLLKYLTKAICKCDHDQLMYFALMLSIISTLFANIGDNLNVFGIIWILLGIGYSAIVELIENK